GRTAINT
ncbi:ktr system potassium uptake B domain protein, partial [Vibrio parahaemolyticus V-223/04]